MNPVDSDPDLQHCLLDIKSSQARHWSHTICFGKLKKSAIMNRFSLSSFFTWPFWAASGINHSDSTLTFTSLLNSVP